jgi:hypothetical protein
MRGCAMAVGYKECPKLCRFYWGGYGALDKLSLVLRLCSLHPGEIRRTIRFVLVATLTFSATYGANTLLDGLFLDHVGASGLPIVYFCASLACLILASPTLQALTRLTAGNLFCIFSASGILLFGLGALALAGWLGRLAPPFWYFCSTAGEVYLIVMYTQTWAFVDHCFDLQEAKRLYGLFHASALLGAAGGSVLVSTLVPKVGPSLLFALFGCITLIALALAATTRNVPFRQDRLEGQIEARLSLRDFLRQIIKSRYVISLLGFNTIMLLLQVVTEYSYLASIEEALVGSAAIAAFIGKCRAWVFFGMALFGALFFSRMIRRLGLRRSVMIPPLYFATLFASWLLGDGLLMGVLGIVAVEGVLAGMEDSNFHLLVNSVDPKLKAKLRVTAEQVLEPAAMLIGSSLLLICQQASKIVGLSLSMVALGLVILLRAALPTASRGPSGPDSIEGRFPHMSPKES